MQHSVHSGNKFIGVMIVCLCVLTSCNRELVEIANPSNIKFVGFNNNNISITADIPAKNNRRFKITIASLDMSVRVNGSYLGTISMAAPISLSPQSDSVYTVPLDVKIKNMLLGSQILFQVTQNKKLNMSIEGYAHVRALGMRKKVKIQYDDAAGTLETKQ